MSHCQACQSLFSRRHVKTYKDYPVRPSAPNFTRELETSTGNQVCSFCAYLRDMLFEPIDPQDETQATRSEGVEFAYGVSFTDPKFTSDNVNFTYPKHNPVIWNGRKGMGFKGYVTDFSHQKVRVIQELWFILKSQLNTAGIDLNSQNTDSGQSLIVAEKWIQKCLSTHKNCIRFSETVEDSHFWLPTRLLDVSRQDKETEDTIRLISRPSLQESKEYVTLSYCWGEDASFTKLVSAKLSTFQSGIELTQLPQTFRDAVQVTRRLNYRYLWIDALCIIQDSQQDWLQEALSMEKVFAFSALNLAAAASESADGGLFRDREPDRLNGCNISVGWEKLGGRAMEKGIYHIFRQNTFKRLLNHSKLERRGWTFQERLLSPRTLHFGEDQMYWECFNGSRSEAYPEIEADDHSLKQRFGEASHNGRFLSHYLWDEITRVYSRRKLTFNSDKLVALAGIAARMTREFKPEDYLAGLWRPTLPQSLLWYSLEVGVLARPYRAPSWSWASIDGAIQYQLLFETSIVAEVLASTVSTNDGSFGPVTNGSLLVKGFVCGAASIMPRYLVAGTHVIWDVGSGPSDLASCQDNLFLLPVVMKRWNIRMSELEGPYGLVLEPIQNVKGRFRRVGFFEVKGADGRLFWEDLAENDTELDAMGLLHLFAEASKSWVRIHLFLRALRKAFKTPTLDESNYQDFDGRSKYTIEIV